MSRRTDRVAALVQAELSELILKKLKDPRIGFVTLTGVEMSPDLKSASVYYSVLGERDAKEGSQKGLEHAAGFLQHGVARALKLRFTPKLVFRLDESWEQGHKIDRILKELDAEKHPRSQDGST